MSSDAGSGGQSQRVGEVVFFKEGLHEIHTVNDRLCSSYHGMSSDEFLTHIVSEAVQNVVDWCTSVVSKRSGVRGAGVFCSADSSIWCGPSSLVRVSQEERVEEDKKTFVLTFSVRETGLPLAEWIVDSSGTVSVVQIGMHVLSSSCFSSGYSTKNTSPPSAVPPGDSESDFLPLAGTFGVGFAQVLAFFVSPECFRLSLRPSPGDRVTILPNRLHNLSALAYRGKVTSLMEGKVEVLLTSGDEEVFPLSEVEALQTTESAGDAPGDAVEICVGSEVRIPEREARAMESRCDSGVVVSESGQQIVVRFEDGKEEPFAPHEVARSDVLYRGSGTTGGSKAVSFRPERSDKEFASTSIRSFRPPDSQLRSDVASLPWSPSVSSSLSSSPFFFQKMQFGASYSSVKKALLLSHVAIRSPEKEMEVLASPPKDSSNDYPEAEDHLFLLSDSEEGCLYVNGIFSGFLVTPNFYAGDSAFSSSPPSSLCFVTSSPSKVASQYRGGAVDTEKVDFLLDLYVQRGGKKRVETSCSLLCEEKRLDGFMALCIEHVSTTEARRVFTDCLGVYEYVYESDLNSLYEDVRSKRFAYTKKPSQLDALAVFPLHHVLFEEEKIVSPKTCFSGPVFEWLWYDSRCGQFESPVQPVRATSYAKKKMLCSKPSLVRAEMTPTEDDRVVEVRYFGKGFAETIPMSVKLYAALLHNSFRTNLPHISKLLYQHFHPFQQLVHHRIFAIYKEFYNSEAELAPIISSRSDLRFLMREVFGEAEWKSFLLSDMQDMGLVRAFWKDGVFHHFYYNSGSKEDEFVSKLDSPSHERVEAGGVTCLVKKGEAPPLYVHHEPRWYVVPPVSKGNGKRLLDLVFEGVFETHALGKHSETSIRSALLLSHRNRIKNGEILVGVEKTDKFVFSRHDLLSPGLGLSAESLAKSKIEDELREMDESMESEHYEDPSLCFCGRADDRWETPSYFEGEWVGCDGCDSWHHMKCGKLKNLVLDKREDAKKAHKKQKISEDDRYSMVCPACIIVGKSPAKQQAKE